MLRFYLLASLAFCAASAEETVIAFGSCAKHSKPQTIWSALAQHSPQAFIWTGDAVYADTVKMKKMKRDYDRQLAVPEYKTFIKNRIVDGVWDDHDYGANNVGKEYPQKEQSQELFLDFLNIPEDHPRRKRQGVYGKRLVGSVKLLFLDCRYHRDQPGPEGSILGDDQWQWLETELKEHNEKIQLTILVSGIQVVAKDHSYEKWDNFPNERKRLLDLIATTKAKGVIAVSGDRHISELSKEEEGAPYPLYDLTASSLTHTWFTAPEEPNSKRIDEPYHDANNAGIVRLTDDTVIMQIINDKGAIVIDHRVPLKDLQ